MPGSWKMVTASAVQTVARYASGAFAPSPPWWKLLPQSLRFSRMSSVPLSRRAMYDRRHQIRCIFHSTARFASMEEGNSVQVEDDDRSGNVEKSMARDTDVVAKDSGESPPWDKPRIEFVRHGTAPLTGAAWRVLATYMEWDGKRAKELIKFGGFYHKPGKWPESAKPQRELEPKALIKEGEYIRVFPDPKKYPICRNFDWEARIVYETENMMMVDKPPGVPCHPTLDNFNQNMLTGLKEKRPNDQLFLPHRLDLDTSGLLLVAKNHKTLLAINDLINIHGIKVQNRLDSPRVRRSHIRAIKDQKITRSKLQKKAREIARRRAENRFDDEKDLTLDDDLGDHPVQKYLDNPLGSLTKRYRALVKVQPGTPPLSPGVLVHYQKNNQVSPKLFVTAIPADPPEESPTPPPMSESEKAREWRIKNNLEWTPDQDLKGVKLVMPKGIQEFPDLKYFLPHYPARPPKQPQPTKKANTQKYVPVRIPWLECRLTILSVRDAPPVPGSSNDVQGGERLQEVEIELLTGRTHQIRGQLAAVGCPIYGDQMYGRDVHWGRFRDRSKDATQDKGVGTTGETGGASDVGGTSETGGTPTVGSRGTQGGKVVQGHLDRVVDSDVNGSVVGSGQDSGTEREAVSSFVDSPFLALQAHEIVMEMKGITHQHCLGRDTCWWYNVDHK